MTDKKNKKIIALFFIGLILSILLPIIKPLSFIDNPGINDDLSNKILIFYSKDCSNCKAIEKNINTILRKHKDVIIIDVDQKNGEEFINKFGMKKLATAYYVPINKTVDYEYINENKANLVKKDKNGQKIFNQEEFDRLLEKQKKKE